MFWGDKPDIALYMPMLALSIMNLSKPIQKSVKEYARGIIGGLLFSFPLLYTMEVWWAGYTSSYLHLLYLVVFTFVILLGYNRYSGMHPAVNWKNIFLESIEEMGIGLVLSFVVLLLLDRLNFDNGFHDVVGKVVIEAMMVSVGVSVGTAQLGSSTNRETKDRSGEGEEESRSSQEDGGGSSEKRDESVGHSDGKKADRRSGKLAIAVMAICGSLLVASSVAPTDEIVLLAAECGPDQIFAIAVLSIVLTLVTGYFSNFKGTDRSGVKINTKDIIYVTNLCYLSALMVSAFLLWYFGRFKEVDFYFAIKQLVLLGIIASLGGSAGRLLIR